LRAAARHFEILAIEESEETAEYGWDEQPHQDTPTLRKISLLRENERPAKPASEIARLVQDILTRENPEAVFIPGWNDAAAFGALQWGVKSGIPIVLMSESTRSDESRGRLKEFVKRRVIKLCAAALVGGTPQLEYMQELGMTPEQIVTGYDAIDNEHFALGATRAREDDHATRTGLGLPACYFLASARFIEKKNLFNLLRAYADYRRAACETAWDLVLLGDGPLKSDLCRLIGDLGLHDCVVLPGFRQYDELPLYYGLASAFVHASLSEPWGLVVNEALAASLPVIVSQQCGCARDLVIDRENGFQFDANDSHALGSLLARVASMSPADLSAMGNRGKKIVDDWSPDNFGKQFERATIAARESIPRQFNLFGDVLLRILIARYNSTAAKLLPVKRSATTG
jgi:glycosyltransferase involved in cell wall biosynthesis